MQEVEKKQNGHGYDVFTIVTDSGSFEISFQNNLDLYWRFINKESMLDSPERQEVIITKENYYIYVLFDNLYESIKSNKIYYGNGENDYFEEKINKLYKNGKIQWLSDDFYDEIASKLIIEKEDEIFKVTFVKSKKECDGIGITYSIRFRNSGSRHEPFNISFMNMYNQLKQYDPNYHQVHIEEVLYKQKVLRK